MRQLLVKIEYDWQILIMIFVSLILLWVSQWYFCDKIIKVSNICYRSNSYDLTFSSSNSQFCTNLFFEKEKRKSKKFGNENDQVLGLWWMEIASIVTNTFGFISLKTCVSLVLHLPKFANSIDRVVCATFVLVCVKFSCLLLISLKRCLRRTLKSSGELQATCSTPAMRYQKYK